MVGDIARTAECEAFLADEIFYRCVPLIGEIQEQPAEYSFNADHPSVDGGYLLLKCLDACFCCFEPFDECP